MSLEKAGSFVLSNEQWNELEKFAPIWYSPKKLGQTLGLHDDELKHFIILCKNPDSDIYKAILTARLKDDAEIKVSLLGAAKASSGAAKDLRKIQREEKLEAARDEIFPGMAEFINQRHTLKESYAYNSRHYEALQEWILSGKPMETASEQLQEYWKRLKIVRDISSDFRSRARGNEYMVNLVRQSVGCSESHAYVLIREAASFFTISEPKTVWYNRMLSNLDKLFYLAMADNQIELAMNIIGRAESIVGKIQDSTDLPPELYEGRTIITSHKPEDFGLEPVDRNKLKLMINRWKIEKEQKEKLLLDAGIKENEENIS